MNRLVCVAVALCWIGAHPVRAADWKMDAPASRLEFAASFEKTPAPGVFKEFDVRLAFDPATTTGNQLDVVIKLVSADMASDDINKAIAGVEWFDYARHQLAQFHSTDIQPLSMNPALHRYVARGMLSLKGVQQPVDVPFTWTAGSEGSTMEGQFTVKRAAFGIGTGEWLATDVIGADVVVKFSVRLRKGP
jgi:polyisoprenoid-binding protein YceI